MLILYFITFFLCTTIHSIINPMNIYTSQPSIIQAKAQATVSTIPLTLAATTNSPAIPENITVTVNQSPGITALTPSLNSSGIVIEREGIFQLNTPLKHQGSTHAIIITTSNVVLDLNNQTIFFAGNTRLEPPLCGIFIVPGVSNVTIKNGTICGFPGPGISIGIIASDRCSNITVDSVTIHNCYDGIFLSSVNNSVIKNCTVFNNTDPSLSTMGIKICECLSVVFKNCSSFSNKNNTGQSYGFYALNSTSITLDTCKAHANQGCQTTYGFHFKGMLDYNLITHCFAQANISLNNDSYGFLIENSEHLFIENSCSQNNTTKNFYSSSYGIYIKNSSFILSRNNIVEYNDYGIYDDELYGQETNVYIKNSALANNKIDYTRPFSSPLPFKIINQNFLQGTLQVGALDNISIKKNTL